MTLLNETTLAVEVIYFDPGSLQSHETSGVIAVDLSSWTLLEQSTKSADKSNHYGFDRIVDEREAQERDEASSPVDLAL